MPSKSSNKSRFGVSNPSAKLTEDQVKEIIRLRDKEHLSQYALADRFGVTRQSIKSILCGKTWAVIPRPVGLEEKLPTRNKRYEWLVDAVKNHTGNRCLLWPFKTTKAGYGRLKVKNGTENVLAHHVAYFLRHGVYPSPWGLHKCNNPRCLYVHPDHVYAGTPARNALDRKESNRGNRPHGERNPSAKLSSSQITEIRNLYHSGKLSQCALAHRFRVHQTQISRIVRKEAWSIVT